MNKSMKKFGLATGVLLVSTTLIPTFGATPVQASTGKAGQASVTTKKFPDVKEFEAEINFLVDKGIINGNSDGTFKPKDSLKRVHAVQMIMREMGIKNFEAPNPGFSDMKPGDYGFNEVAKAVQLGFINGTVDAKGNKTFKPNGTLTRGEMAKILTEAYDIKTDKNITFKDIPEGHWTKGYVSRLATAGITNGHSDGTFKPNDAIERQHFAAFMARLLNPEFIPSKDPVPTAPVVTPAPPQVTAPTPPVTPSASLLVKKYTTTENLNMRSGGSVNYGIILSIPKGATVMYVSEASTGWYKVTYGGKTGYVSPTYLQFVIPKTYKSTSYPISLAEMSQLQFQLNGQTDAYRLEAAYIKKTSVQKINPTDTTGTVLVDSPVVSGDTKHTYGILKKSSKVTITGETTLYYKVNYQTWRNARLVDITPKVDPKLYAKGTPEYYQFLDLSVSANVSATEMNKVVSGKGILNGKGQAFIDASDQHGVNEVYLVSHALLETGNGTSQLANGVTVSSVDGKPVTPMKVYNMFGIGAIDVSALKSGSERAYKEGWTTPEKAIIGGAKFIGEMYVNNPTYKQNTLYKMRWNPENPGKHQYATDIGWAVKQTKSISNIYSTLDEYSLTYDVPVYQ